MATRILSKFAGVLPPTTAPKSRLGRRPLYKRNVRVLGLLNNDPTGATGASGEPIYHFANHGNNLLEVPYHADMLWADVGDYFAFKCYFKPNVVDGRHLIYSAKRDPNSGGIFVDHIDGRLRVGWYDSVQRREVAIATDIPVLDRGVWHYINVRKKFPVAALGSGCWEDSIFEQTAALANDLLISRRVVATAGYPSVGGTAGRPSWDVRSLATSVREAISFTTDLEYSIPNTTLSGLVSNDTETYTGAVGGVINADTGSPFHLDMTGCYFQWGVPSSSPFHGVVYRIGIVSATQAIAVNEATGLTEDFSSLVGQPAGVFFGVKLVKTEGFEDAESPDAAPYALSLFGSRLAQDPSSGIAQPFCEFDSFAYHVSSHPSGAGATLFEAAAADEIETGTDYIRESEIAPAANNRLQVDSNVHVAVHSQVYALTDPLVGTQFPNKDLELVLDSVSSGTANPPKWKFVRPLPELTGKRKVRVAFYDPDQAQISNPGPELAIAPPGEDATSPSGFVSFDLYDIPISRDRGPIETWVYMTQADGEDFFFVASVTDRSTSISISKTDLQVASGRPLEFDNGPPPECDIVESGDRVLAYGALRRFSNTEEGVPVQVLDGITFSKAGFPVSVPGSNFLTIPDGSSERITGMRFLTGRMVVGKEDGWYRASLRQGEPSFERLTMDGRGIVSHASMVVYDRALFALSNDGIAVYDGSGIPFGISNKLKTFFRYGGVDVNAAALSVAAINHLRGQYVLLLREAGSNQPGHRITVEPSEIAGGWRFGRCDGPDLTAIASSQDPYGSVQRLIGGTSDGFVVWLERGDSKLLMMGEDASYYGDVAFTVGAGSTVNFAALAVGDVDESLEGMRGVIFKWPGGERKILLSDPGALYVDKQFPSALANGTALTAGQLTRRWSTKWLDMGAPEVRKKAHYLDVIHTIQSSGSVRVIAYVDFDDATPYPLPRDTALQPAIDLTEGFTRIDIGHLQRRYYRFEFQSEDIFELTEMVARVSYADPY